MALPCKSEKKVQLLLIYRYCCIVGPGKNDFVTSLDQDQERTCNLLLLNPVQYRHTTIIYVVKQTAVTTHDTFIYRIRLHLVLTKYRNTGNFRVVHFSRNFAVSINPRKLKSAKYFPILFEKLVLRNYWRIWLQFEVVTYSPAVRPVICNYLKTVCHHKPFD